MAEQSYDFGAPGVSGTSLTVDWYMADPRRIYRALRTLMQQRLIGKRVLGGRVDLTGTGSTVYEIAESIYADLNGTVVPPLSEYPYTTTSPGTLAVAKPSKTGERKLISDETIAHNRRDEFMRDLVKIANTLAFQSDGLHLAAIASQVTQNVTAGAVWTGSTGNPFQDVMLASAKIDTKNQGYEGRVLVTTPTGFAYVISRAATLDYMPREDAANALQSGNMARIGGLTILKTTNMPTGLKAFVADPLMLGSIAWESLGGGYQGSANPDSDSNGVESKRYRAESKDGVNVQARVVQVPMIQEPDAACYIGTTGL